MIQITMSEYLNGFTVVAYDWKAGKKFIDEIFEERIDALKSIERYLNNEIIGELERRTQYAAEM